MTDRDLVQVEASPAAAGSTRANALPAGWAVDMHAVFRARQLPDEPWQPVERLPDPIDLTDLPVPPVLVISLVPIGRSGVVPSPRSPRAVTSLYPRRHREHLPLEPTTDSHGLRDRQWGVARATRRRAPILAG